MAEKKETVKTNAAGQAAAEKLQEMASVEYVCLQSTQVKKSTGITTVFAGAKIRLSASDEFEAKHFRKV